MRAGVIRIAAAAAALVAAAPADAQGPPVPGDSAASQYVEVVPSADGATQPGSAPAPTAKRRTLPPSVTRQLRATGGSDAAALRRLSTSPSLGAPARVAAPREAVRAPRPSREAAPAAIRSALVTSVTSSGGDGRLALLGAGLAAITAATIVAAIRRARSEGRRPGRQTAQR